MSTPAPPSSTPSRTALQTDVRRRTVLPSTLSNLRSASSAGSGGRGELDLPSDEYLDKVEEELNRRVDRDVEVLVDGLRDLVALAKLPPPTAPQPPSSHPHQAHLSAPLRTESMLKAAHDLVALAGQLKLLHLFGDGQAGAESREEAERRLSGEIAALKARAAALGAGGGGGP
ncbi:hypothetical protein JCM8097_001111 [Rhodosporidiobolus ruineniae]